jgi:hypothetical protein
MLYGVYSVFKHGFFFNLPKMASIPVSTHPEFWNSRAAYLQSRYKEEMVSFPVYVTRWLASPPRKLEQFEKMLVVACKGIDQVEIHSAPNIVC